MKVTGGHVVRYLSAELEGGCYKTQNGGRNLLILILPDGINDETEIANSKQVSVPRLFVSEIGDT